MKWDSKQHQAILATESLQWYLPAPNMQHCKHHPRAAGRKTEEQGIFGLKKS